MYDSKTKVVFTHPIEKFIDKDMNNFKDSRGQNLVDLETKALEKDDIAYIKIYFNKPNNLKKEFPKIICITKFEPLDIVLGIGEYLDVIEKQIKGYVLNRFSQIKDNKEDRYLFILDVHDMKGGDDFATVLLNSNKPELVGRKVSDKGTDVKGNRFRKNFLNLIEKNGGGYSEYWYKKPSTKTPALKMSYVYLQKDWNWIIGSGFYYEDLEKQVSIMQKSITSHTNNTINEMLLWVSLLSFFAIIIAIFVSYMIDKTIKKYTNTIIEYEDNKRKQENIQVQQSKMAAMGEMLGNIAHQWRQPLSAISTAATGAKIQKEMDCLTDNQLMSSLTAINKSAQYLSSTINDFRTFLEPSESKISKFNISDTLDKTLNLLNAQFSAKDIEIIKNIESSELKSIENELIQVLMNILNNARDALITKEKQKRLIFIDSYKKDNTLFIEILDNAGGVSETIIDRIFEPYFTTKHKSQGTGIGLYMSQDIVKNHLNGLLLVSNKEYHHKDTRYKGAKFTIKISLC